MHRLQDRVLITCNLSQNCTNRITLLVRARDVRLCEEAQAKAPRMIRFASAVANIPPGATKTVRLKLTKRGKDVVSKKKKRRLKGVIENQEHTRDRHRHDTDHDPAEITSYAGAGPVRPQNSPIRPEAISAQGMISMSGERRRRSRPLDTSHPRRSPRSFMHWRRPAAA